MKNVFLLALTLCGVASACSYTERTVVEKPVPVAPATVAYSDPPPAPAVVYVPSN